MEKCSFFMKHADGRDTIWTTSEPGPWFNIKFCCLINIGNPIVKIIRVIRFTSNWLMGYPILVRWHLYTVSGRSIWYTYHNVAQSIWYMYHNVALSLKFKTVEIRDDIQDFEQWILNISTVILLQENYETNHPIACSGLQGMGCQFRGYSCFASVNIMLFMISSYTGAISCTYVQNFIGITSLQLGWDQNQIFIEFKIMMGKTPS